MSACAACGRRRAPSHLFCAGCGSLLPPPSEPAVTAAPRKKRIVRPRVPLLHSLDCELKQISVLFVDLCGSTARISASDPEAAREYLDRALRLMSDAVELYGGTVSQRRGDGLLALFGAPVAHEDHPLRACLAALAMQERVRTASPEGTPEHERMVLRVGVHSGEAVVGLVADYLGSYYRADGPTVHLASRLEQLAGPGRVLISEATRRQLGDEVQSQPLGPHTLRGFERRVELHELVLSQTQSAAAPLTRRRRWGPFVGRETAMQGLADVARRVLGGRLLAVGLQGEAGVGKSRLLAEFCSSETASAFAVCTAHARGYLSESPFAFAADLARALMPAMPEASAGPGAVVALGADALRHADALADLLGSAIPGEDWGALTPRQRRRRMGDALAWLVQRRAQQRPLLLALEDLFLADDDSQRLLDSVLRRLEALPLMVCASYRGKAPHRWSDHGWFSEQRLALLCEDDMLALARSIVGNDASLAGIVAALVERSGGKPFFLEQLAITLVDEGTLIGPPGDYRLARGSAEWRIPASIVAVVAGLVDRLPAAAKASIEAAAILGEPISAGVIGAMQERPAGAAEAELQSCVTSGLLSQAAAAPPGVYAFRHALVQEAVLSTLTGPRRRQLHRGALHALRDSLGDSALDWAAVLTHHAVGGEDWVEAVNQAVKAMTRAIARSANRECMNLFAVGLEALRHVEPEPLRLQLEIGLRQEAIGAQMPLGELDEILVNLQRADAVAKQLGDQRRVATVASQLAAFLWMRGRYTEGLACAEQARAAGALAQRRNLQMTAGQVRLMMNHGLGRYREAIEDAHQIRQAFAAELERPGLMSRWATIPSVNLRSFLASSLWRCGEVEAAQAVCDEAYAELAALDHFYSRGLIDFVQAQIWVERGSPERALALMQAAVRMCESHDVPTLFPCVVALLAAALTATGRAEDAAARLEQAFAARAHDAGGSYGEFFMRHQLALACSALGRHDEAIAFSRQAADFARAGEQHGHRVEALSGWAEALVAAGRPADALEVFDELCLCAQACDMRFFVERARRRRIEVSAGLLATRAAAVGGSGEQAA